MRDFLDRVAYVLPNILLCVWYTILCGGFAYLYWVVGFHDIRDIFPPLFSDIGAIMVFPVGWIGLLFYACET